MRETSISFSIIETSFKTFDYRLKLACEDFSILKFQIYFKNMISTQPCFLTKSLTMLTQNKHKIWKLRLGLNNNYCHINYMSAMRKITFLLIIPK